jgi:hypothetical protein
MNDILEQRRLEALAIAEAAASATLDMDITADLEVDD